MKSIDGIKTSLANGGTDCRGVRSCSKECAYFTECRAYNPDYMSEMPRQLFVDALTLIRQLQYALLLMLSQYCTEDDGSVFHRFMSAGEHAFAVLGITEPSIHESDLEAMIESLEKEMYPK